MLRDTTKRFYLMHGWLGAITGVVLFVICYTGSVSVFGIPELKVWSNPGLHHAYTHSPEALEKLVRNRANEVPPEYLDSITVQMPGSTNTAKLVVSFEHEAALPGGAVEHQLIRFEHDPATLNLVARKEGHEAEIYQGLETDMADFITTFHADLHLGDPLGLVITGILGLTLLASVITGVVVHRKILREAMVFRPYRSVRLLLADSHKLFGVWGLPFHIVTAFTGAFLGLAAVLLLPAAAVVSFGGDMQAMIDEYLPTDMPNLSGEAAPIRFAHVMEAAQERETGAVTFITLLAPQDGNARVMFNTLAGQRDMVGEILRYRSADGVLEESFTVFGRLGGPSGALLDALFPLHFGNFGGLPVKMLWFVFGLSTALLAVSGLMIWIERRLQGSVVARDRTHYHRLAKFICGACCGLVVAVGALFLVQPVLGALALDSGLWLGTVFFGCWAATTLWAMIRDNVYISARDLLTLAGVIHVAAPVANGWVTGNHLLNVLIGRHYVVAGVDIGLILAGGMLLFAAYRVPRERASGKRRAAVVQAAGPQPESP